MIGSAVSIHPQGFLDELWDEFEASNPVVAKPEPVSVRRMSPREHAAYVAVMSHPLIRMNAADIELRVTGFYRQTKPVMTEGELGNVYRVGIWKNR